ncbi:MAG: hypothetical protein JWQ90_402 [Hydrocarboniphaga sp.]|uniref:DUF2970 domain-containing protein n=1 Tax=Hydrocarboniphaga sp. TaxID=2033016 RepID=UPI0026228550|nr:DUF2970 domain-containing protein [Hydrocarboniphaga sp.]MDB5967952.1 hypothetical protein [Hydrocarboniphaga sp.]
MTPHDKDPKPPRISFWQTVSSVLAAFFGVQSSKARKRDFSSGNPLAFVVVALLMTGLFVLLLLAIVRVIMHFAVAA